MSFKKDSQVRVMPSDNDDPLALEMAGRLFWYVTTNYVGHAIVEIRETKDTKTRRFHFRPADLQPVE